MKRRALAALALPCTLLGACAAREAETQSPAPGLGRVSHCRYDARVRSLAPCVLAVRVECSGRGILGLEAASERVAEATSRVQSSLGDTTRNRRAFLLSAPAARVRFEYEVALDTLRGAASLRSALAVQSGNAWLLPASSFLLYPLPLDVGIPVELRFDAGPARDFASGLRREGDHFELEAHEIPVATYGVFGTFARARSELAGREMIELVRIGERGPSAGELMRWVEPRARAVADFFGRFPAQHVLLAALPVEGHGVSDARLLPESAPGIALLLGADTTPPELARDSVLVHELFHLGVPAFDVQGRWFDEGLAMYFEPILRVRAGLLSEAELWRTFATQLPRALESLRAQGLERARGATQVYWGGAVFCLLADVAAREQSALRLGLEDGVRRVFAAGGTASEVWSLSEALSVADGAFSQPALLPWWERLRKPSPTLELEPLFRKLGVLRAGSDVVLSEEAEGAALRRALVWGAHGRRAELAFSARR